MPVSSTKPRAWLGVAADLGRRFPRRSDAVCGRADLLLILDGLTPSLPVQSLLPSLPKTLEEAGRPLPTDDAGRARLADGVDGSGAEGATAGESALHGSVPSRCLPPHNSSPERSARTMMSDRS